MNSFEAQQKMAKTRNKVLSKVSYMQNHFRSEDLEANRMLNILYDLYNDYEKDRMAFVKTLEHEGGVK